LTYVIKAMAERRAGELVKELQEAGELAKPGQPKKEISHAAIFLADLGLSPTQSSRFQRQAILTESGVGRRLEMLKVPIWELFLPTK
jgi:hypothetical protein